MLSEKQRDEIVSAVLQSGLDDWVSLSELSSIADFYGVTASEVRSKIPSVPEWAIEPVIREVVGRGLMQVGDVYKQGRFVAFDGDDESSIEWMLGVYREAGDIWPFEAWLALTETGEALAETLPRARYLDEPWPFDSDGNRL